MKILKIIFFNIIILSLLIILSEIGWRVALTIKNYNIPVLSYFGKTWYRADPNLRSSNKLGKFDDKLIQSLKSNLEIIDVEIPRFEKNARISSDSLGFRNNFNNMKFENNKLRILTVGDSFTFGDQVSDQSTWPSCLERELKIKTDNGGFGGYSAGQSVRKGIIESEKRKYSHIIWSIFFHDFERDFSKNLIISNQNGKLEFNNNIVNKENKASTQENLLYGYLKEYSFLVYHFDYKIIPRIKNIFKDKRGKENENLEKEETFYGIEYSSLERNIEFLLKEFNGINIEKKIILYQYGEDFKKSKYLIMNEKVKTIINKYLKNYDILVIDTSNEFFKLDDKKLRLLWFDHHTAYGNEIVCKYIISKMKANKFD